MLILVAVKHLQDDLFRSIPPDVRGIPPEVLWRILDQQIFWNFLKMSLRWSFFFCKNCRFIPAILQKRYRPFLPKNLLYFTVYIFFRTDLVDSFRTCSEGCVICNYSKASETKKCLHIGASFYQVVNQTCNFVAMKYNCLCMFL